MNQLLVALALVSATQQSQPTPAEAASQAAVQAFTEACVQGQFRLSPARGRILAEDEIAGILTPASQEHHITVKLNYPPQTYLMFVHYGQLQPHSIASDCVLVSRSITKQDAMTALMATAPEVEPVISTLASRFLPEWTIDQPKKGFRSGMNIKQNGVIVLHVAMYNDVSEQAGATQH